MKWRGRQRSSNIEDRRGRGGLGGMGRSGFGSGRFRIPSGGGRRGFSGGLGFLVVIFVIAIALGINPLQLITGGPVSTDTSGGAGSSYSSSRPGSSASEDDLAAFISVVVRETEVMWSDIFAANDMQYSEPTVVLFSGQDSSACGLADARTGPFYCPADQKVYIDLSFYEQLRRQFGAPGDFAQAYVIAHEIGHHVQNLTGILPEFNQARQSMSQEEANAYSVRVELQADCYAGVWAHYAGQENLLESGDIEEALNAAEQIGDDTLQKRTQGFAVPKTFSHGTSEQRRRWFERGFDQGDPGSCDTFEVNNP